MRRQIFLQRLAQSAARIEFAMLPIDVLKEGEKLGLKHIGFKSGLHWFNDPHTKSTIVAKPDWDLDQLKEHLKKSRGTFEPLGLGAIERRLVALAAKLDLGDKWEAERSCPPSPSLQGVHYPSLYLNGKTKPIDLPEKGKATVEYRVVNRSTNKRNGEERHSADIEIRSIEPQEADEDEQPKEGDRAKLLSDLRGLRRLYFDSRPRNENGQYIGNETGGVDPNSMAAAYGTDRLPEPGAVNESRLARIKKFFAGRREAAAA